MTFHPKHPNFDQNLQFTLLTETTSIPVTSMWESLSPHVPPMGGYTTLYSGHIAIKGTRDQGGGRPGWGLPYERGGDTRRKCELDS